MTDEMMGLIRQQINTLYPLDEASLDALMNGWVEISVKRKTVLTHEGMCEGYMYLVLEGIQQVVFTHHHKEATLVFTYPYSFSGVLDSFLLQKPATCRLETITQSRLLKMPYSRLMDIVSAHPSLNAWLWNALAGVLSGTLQRQCELLTFNAEEKFVALLRRSPQVLNLIPHKYLAAYIGVDASTFSKMMGSIRV